MTESPSLTVTFPDSQDCAALNVGWRQRIGLLNRQGSFGTSVVAEGPAVVTRRQVLCAVAGATALLLLPTDARAATTTLYPSSALAPSAQTFPKG